MTKTLEEIWLKTTKILLRPLDRSNRERKSFEQSLNSEEHVRNSVLKKTLYTIFDWSKNRFDCSKMLRLIQNQSSIDWNTQKQTKILIAISIGWKTLSIGRNYGKNSFLKIKAKYCRYSSKALNFMNKMHEYEMKCFSKTLVWNPVFPKLRFSNNSP